MRGIFVIRVNLRVCACVYVCSTGCAKMKNIILRHDQGCCLSTMMMI